MRPGGNAAPLRERLEHKDRICDRNALEKRISRLERLEQRAAGVCVVVAIGGGEGPKRLCNRLRKHLGGLLQE